MKYTSRGYFGEEDVGGVCAWLNFGAFFLAAGAVAGYYDIGWSGTFFTAFGFF